MTVSSGIGENAKVGQGAVSSFTRGGQPEELAKAIGEEPRGIAGDEGNREETKDGVCKTKKSGVGEPTARDDGGLSERSSMLHPQLEIS